MTASSEATWLTSGWADTVLWRAGASFVRLSRSSAKGKIVLLTQIYFFEWRRKILASVFCLLNTITPETLSCLTLQSGIFPSAHRRSRLHRGGLCGKCGADWFLRSHWKELCHSECRDTHGHALFYLCVFYYTHSIQFYHKWMPTFAIWTRQRIRQI